MFVTFSSCQLFYQQYIILGRAIQDNEPWFHTAGAFYDPSHPFFIYKAFQDQPQMRHLVSGTDSEVCKEIPEGPEPSDAVNFITKLFEGCGQFNCFYVVRYSDGL